MLGNLSTYFIEALGVSIILAAGPHPDPIRVVEFPRKTWKFEFSSCNRVTSGIKIEAYPALALVG